MAAAINFHNVRDAKGKFVSVNPNGPKRKRPVSNVSRPHVSSLAMTTHYFIVLDRSSSMSHLRQATINAFNTRLATLRQELIKYPNQNFTVTLITFSDNVDSPTFNKIPLNQVQNLTWESYRPGGNTALLDAVGKAIEHCNATQINPQDAFLIEVITDGEENRSNIYGGHTGQNWSGGVTFQYSLPEVMMNCKNKGNYTIVFQVPRGYKMRLNRDFNIPLDNINEWEQTEVGTQNSTQCTTQGLENYITARSLGVKTVNTFYKTVDLSNVKTNDLNKLNDLQHQFKVLEVAKEAEIRDYVEDKTKMPYIVGSSYYELTKDGELVQPNKQVLVMKRGEKGIYGGAQARNLLGLPHNANAKLTIHNLNAFRIFIESNSFNRKLVRGSWLLLDKNKFVHSQPTWGTIQ